MRTHTPVIRRLAAIAVVAVVVTACGGDVAEAPDPSDAAESADGRDPDPADAGGAATVTVAATSLGEVLVDADGMTLYVFEPDERGPSTCVDACAANWPPLIVDDAPEAGEGVDPSMLGTVERDDGTMQVTYDGWPLYGWIADDAPGDVTGQGVEDVWWVIAADGAIVTSVAGDVDDTADAEADEDAGAPSYEY